MQKEYKNPPHITGGACKKTYRNPPRFAEWLVIKILPDSKNQTLLGDLGEIYNTLYNESGSLRSGLWYWAQILKSLPGFVNNYLYWSIVMFKSYFKFAWRNILRYKGFSFINFFGLTFGITCSILILLFVNYEFSFDNFHNDRDRIFKLGMIFSATDQPDSYSSWTPPTLAPNIISTYPEVEHVVRLYPTSGVVKYKDLIFNESAAYYVDSSFFQIFDFELSSGSRETALKLPYSVVITENIAMKYFGSTDVTGETILYKNKYDLEITGVLKNIPGNSHLNPEILISFSTITDIFAQMDYSMAKSWFSHGFLTYVKISSTIPSKQLVDGIYYMSRDLAGDMEEESGFTQRFEMENLQNLYLHSKFDSEDDLKTGNIANLYGLIIIALSIIVLACINYTNLSTARYMKRFKEIGLRKVVGARRIQLVSQCYSETFILCFASTVIATFFVKIILPYYSIFTDAELLFSLFDIRFIMFIAGIVLFTVLTSGTYPAVFLSSAMPAEIFNSNSASRSTGGKVRKLLVNFQFVISIFFITSTLIVIKQIEFVKNQYLGFNKEQLLILDFDGSREAIEKSETLKIEFQRIPGVIASSALSSIPGSYITSRILTPEGLGEKENMTMHNLFSDYDLLETLGISLIAGRFMSEQYSTDADEAFILNEAAVKHFGWESPESALGKELTYGRRKKGKVVGIVKDYHFHSLHKEIFPIVTHYKENEFAYIAVRVNTDNITQTVPRIKEVWESQLPQNPYNYFFLDQSFDNQYKSDDKLSRILNISSVVAILIACLGLFGLSAFIAEQRRKEVGIRKVLGASVLGINLLFYKDFLKWILLSNFIAWPVTWYVMDLWLRDFAYRTEIGINVFFIAGLITLLISLLTISYQSIRTAYINPTDTLRSE